VQDAENRAEKNWLTRKYHKVHLEEIEIQIPRGFFDYAFENLEVFNWVRSQKAVILIQP